MTNSSHLDDDFDLSELSMWRNKKTRMFMLIAVLVVLGTALSLGAFWLTRAPFDEACTGPFDCRSGLCLTFGSGAKTMCSEECVMDSECPATFRCEDIDRSTKACVAAPHVPLGQSCVTPFECLEDGECLFPVAPARPFDPVNFGHISPTRYLSSTGTCHPQGTQAAQDKLRQEQEQAQRKLDEAMRELRNLSPY